MTAQQIAQSTTATLDQVSVRGRIFANAEAIWRSGREKNTSIRSLFIWWQEESVNASGAKATSLPRSRT